VGCGRRVKTLFVQYSPGNIRLMKCVRGVVCVIPLACACKRVFNLWMLSGAG
jgi:hypothetical protein